MKATTTSGQISRNNRRSRDTLAMLVRSLAGSPREAAGAESPRTTTPGPNAKKGSVPGGSKVTRVMAWPFAFHSLASRLATRSAPPAPRLGMTKAMRIHLLATQEPEPDVNGMVSVVSAHAFARRQTKQPPQGYVARQADDGVGRGARIINGHNQPCGPLAGAD